MNLTNFNLLKEKINTYDNIYLLRHQRPDFDALGSQIGLLHILTSKYPNKVIVPVGNDDISNFNFIGKNIEVNSNNIKESLVIVLDTANVQRIEGSTYIELKENENYIVKIDHHPNLEKYGDINIVDETISSTSELVYEIFIEGLAYNLTDEGAKCIYTGIYGDTGGFSFPLTSANTLLVASKLRSYNFDFESLMLNLKELDEKQVKALGWMYENIEITDGIGVLKFRHEDFKNLPFGRKDLSLLVNYLGIFKTLKVWVLMIEYEKFIRVNFRSKRDINVSVIANQFDGGGHKNASGGKIYKWEDSDKVINTIKRSL